MRFTKQQVKNMIAKSKRNGHKWEMTFFLVGLLAGFLSGIYLVLMHYNDIQKWLN